jgi:restriction system protein
LTERGRSTALTYQQARAIFLKWVRIFQEQRRAKAAKAEPPEEVVAEAPGTTPNDYRTTVTDVLLKLPAAGFERLCQRVLREAGFTQVVVTGRSGDGGIDGYGTLSVNPLVSFKVLFQCKRFSDKGIILTTGAFTAEARREASRDGVPPIELVDGEKLVDMLEQLELGLRPMKTYEVDRVFFKEFEG